MINQVWRKNDTSLLSKPHKARIYADVQQLTRHYQIYRLSLSPASKLFCIEHIHLQDPAALKTSKKDKVVHTHISTLPRCVCLHRTLRLQLQRIACARLIRNDRSQCSRSRHACFESLSRHYFYGVLFKKKMISLGTKTQALQPQGA